MFKSNDLSKQKCKRKVVEEYRKLIERKREGKRETEKEQKTKIFNLINLI